MVRSARRARLEPCSRRESSFETHRSAMSAEKIHSLAQGVAAMLSDCWKIWPALIIASQAHSQQYNPKEADALEAWKRCSVDLAVHFSSGHDSADAITKIVLFGCRKERLAYTATLTFGPLAAKLDAVRDAEREISEAAGLAILEARSRH